MTSQRDHQHDGVRARKRKVVDREVRILRLDSKPVMKKFLLGELKSEDFRR